MKIRRYNQVEDEGKLLQIIKNEGEGWSEYSSSEGWAKYKVALQNSITYVCCESNTVCGYSRSIDDNGFYIYVCDLLVAPQYRGNGIGKILMETIYEDYPGYTVFVMSDVDEYYQKQGYRREGSIFEVTNTSETSSS